VVTVVHRLVALTKALVVVAGAVTALCIVVVTSLALATWNYLPISRVLEISGIYVPDRYVTASENRRVSSLDIVDMLLDLPAVVPLLGALALLTLFYVWLSSRQEEWG
jgi:hypothetical protein